MGEVITPQVLLSIRNTRLLEVEDRMMTDTQQQQSSCCSHVINHGLGNGSLTCYQSDNNTIKTIGMIFQCPCLIVLGPRIA